MLHSGRSVRIRQLLILTLMLTAPVFTRGAEVPTPGSSALQQLDATVQKNCGCAASQSSGIRAALACTQDLDTYSKIKLDNQHRWTLAQQQRAEQIERILETCLSKALGYRQTLAKLGINAPFGPPLDPGNSQPTAPYYWLNVSVRQLDQFPSRLVRVETTSGVSAKGLVVKLNAHTLSLRRARIDGGGEIDFKLIDLQSTSILVPSPTAIDSNN